MTWRALTSLDSRSLATFRVTIAILFIYDVIDRMQDLKAHYSSEGILPIEVSKRLLTSGIAQPKVSETANLSLNLLSGHPGWQTAVFTVALLCGVCLLMGIKSRLMAFSAWIFTISLVNSTPLLIYPGDYLMGMLLLAASFVPLGPAPLDSKRLAPAEVSGLCTLPLFTVNFLFMFGAAMAKNGAQWTDGTAIQELISMDQYSTPMRDLILPYPAFMKFMTHMTVWIEMLGPLLLLVPFWGGRVRMFAACALIGFLLGVRFFVSSENLSFICASGYIALLPSSFWTYLDRVRGRNLQKAIPWIPGPQSSWQRLAEKGLGSVSVALVLLLILLEWNRYIRFGYNVTVLPLPNAVQRIVDVARLNNNNAMFANFKGLPDGWVVVLGQTRTGRVIDLISGQPNDLSIEKRNNIANFSLRWRRFFANAFFRQKIDSRNIFIQFYAQYLCRNWEASHPDESLVGDVQVIRLDYQNSGAGRGPTSASTAFTETMSCTQPIEVGILTQ